MLILPIQRKRWFIFFLDADPACFLSVSYDRSKEISQKKKKGMQINSVVQNSEYWLCVCMENSLGME